VAAAGSDRVRKWTTVEKQIPLDTANDLRRTPADAERCSTGENRLRSVFTRARERSPTATEGGVPSRVGRDGSNGMALLPRARQMAEMAA
jgi:hypothetical protein